MSVEERFTKLNATLEEAKQWLKERFEKGTHCPACNQRVKLYARPINGDMARALIEMYHFDCKQPGEWAYTPKLIDQICPSRMSSLLRHWGIIEQRAGEREDGSNRIGYYRITELGRAFVKGTCRVPKYVYLYNERPLSEKTLLEFLGRLPSNETISIDEALGRKFNYRELMQGA